MKIMQNVDGKIGFFRFIVPLSLGQRHTQPLFKKFTQFFAIIWMAKINSFLWGLDEYTRIALFFMEEAKVNIIRREVTFAFDSHNFF